MFLKIFFFTNSIAVVQNNIKKNNLHCRLFRIANKFVLLFLVKTFAFLILPPGRNIFQSTSSRKNRIL